MVRELGCPRWNQVCQVPIEQSETKLGLRSFHHWEFEHETIVYPGSVQLISAVIGYQQWFLCVYMCVCVCACMCALNGALVKLRKIPV